MSDLTERLVKELFRAHRSNIGFLDAVSAVDDALEAAEAENARLRERLDAAENTIADLRGACSRYEAAVKRREAKLAAIDAVLTEHYDPRYSDTATLAIYRILHPEEGQ